MNGLTFDHVIVDEFPSVGEVVYPMRMKKSFYRRHELAIWVIIVTGLVIGYGAFVSSERLLWNASELVLKVIR